jgi:hypothetical protein
MSEVTLYTTLTKLMKYIQDNNIELSWSQALRAVDFLKYYGYLSREKEPNFDELIEGIVKFQEFYHLEPDGILGQKTLRAMDRPRCSVPDFMNRTEEAKWRKKDLTYFIANRDSDLSSNDWDNTLQLAFQQWTDVADIRVVRTNSRNSANIILDIGSGKADNFDGPSGTLAWAYLPDGRDGQLLCKFDTGETWTVDKMKRGILLLNVACHEFGHLLGLEHSKVESALMAPYYSAEISKPQTVDDKSRIQALYGKPVNIPTPPPVDPTPTPTPTDKITVILEGKVTIPGYRLVKITN